MMNRDRCATISEADCLRLAVSTSFNSLYARGCVDSVTRYGYTISTTADTSVEAKMGIYRTDDRSHRLPASGLSFEMLQRKRKSTSSTSCTFCPGVEPLVGSTMEANSASPIVRLTHRSSF